MNTLKNILLNFNSFEKTMNSEYTAKVKQLVDNIKGICGHNGLWGDANEYKIVTQCFLYKFLNDKFLYEMQKINPNLKEYDDFNNLSEDDYNKILEFEIGTKTAHFQPKHLLSYLFAEQDKDDFAKTLDETLNDIAINNHEIFSVHTDGNTEIRLFSESLIQDAISDRSKHNAVAKDIINKLTNSKFDFDEMFGEWFDFFSTIFEYMIKDYNKDGGGKYAEYYTPHSISKVMAKILVEDNTVSNVKVYDPSAGSGTLLMNIANQIGADKCSIYSQDLSQKSSNLLRLNLILNNLSHSIDNIIQWNTIINNKHADKKMDFIVSNPPFKLDFSEWRDKIEDLPNASERFFAGVPKITPKSPNKMAIYLLFLQHIIYSLSDKWKAAIVVPTGFITAQSGIEKKIRERIINNKMLKWVVSMPSNIFATTGTNVSILFIDKENTDDKVVLMDASKLWTKIKEDGKNQKTVLSTEEEQQIIDGFTTKEPIEGLSVVVGYNEIKEKNYSFSAGQYFDIKIEYTDISKEEFADKMKNYEKNLSDYFKESRKLENQIFSQLKDLKYD